MSARPPFGDAEVAALVWARYRRVLRWMLLVMVAMVVVAAKLLYRQASAAAVRGYIVAAVVLALAMLVLSAVMGMAYLRAAARHDATRPDIHQ